MLNFFFFKKNGLCFVNRCPFSPPSVKILRILGGMTETTSNFISFGSLVPKLWLWNRVRHYFGSLTLYMFSKKKQLFKTTSNFSTNHYQQFWPWMHLQQEYIYGIQIIFLLVFFFWNCVMKNLPMMEKVERQGYFSFLITRMVSNCLPIIKQKTIFFQNKYCWNSTCTWLIIIMQYWRRRTKKAEFMNRGVYNVSSLSLSLSGR